MSGPRALFPPPLRGRVRVGGSEGRPIVLLGPLPPTLVRFAAQAHEGRGRR
jgi:hypothetical protein